MTTKNPQPRYVKLNFPCGLIAITTHGAETDGQVLYTFSHLTDVEKGPSRILVPAIVPSIALFDGDFNDLRKVFLRWEQIARDSDRQKVYREEGLQGLITRGPVIYPPIPDIDLQTTQRARGAIEREWRAAYDHKNDNPFDMRAVYCLDAVSRALKM